MSDINSNIRIDFDTGTALAQLRNLQAGLSKFHQTLAEGNLAAANAQKGLTASMIQSINATGKFVASQQTVATSTQAFTTALEKNQLSMKEYFRYSAAAATANTKVLTKAFAAEREILNRARRDRVKALQSQYIQLNNATGAFAQTLKIMPKSLAMANGKFTELGTRIQYAAQRQQFLNQLLKQGSTQLLNFGKNMQWAGRQLMVGLTMPLGMLAGAAAKAFRELEKETVAFRRVYGDMFTSDAETDAAIENIKKIGMEYTKFGIAVKDTMNMAASAAAAGFSGTALENQVKQANKLSVLGQIDQQKALETTISLQNAFGISSDELAKKINFLNAVENQTVVSLDDITTAIPKVAPVIKQLGGSVEDLAFFLTAMEEGGVNASEGANALKSGLAALINPGDKATAMLAGLGINIKGIVEGNAGDLKGTVIGFAQALDTLAPLQRARAIEQLFGKFQFARLSTLFQNVTKDGTQASRTLQLAGASVEELSILSQREMSKVEDAVGVKFEKAIEQFKVTLMPIGKQFLEAVTPVVEFFGKMLEKFNGLGDGTKKVIGILVAALGFIGPAALMAFGLLANGAANVIKFFAMLRGGIAKLNGQTNVLGAGFDYLTQQETENLVQSNALHTSHQRLISVFNVEKGTVDSLAASYGAAATQARSLATSSPGLFAAPGAKAAVSKLPQTRKYADGVLSVPGPKGAGDVTPAMLSPGESVIPTKQSQKHRGLIKAIMADKVPGHIKGRLGTPAKTGKKDQSQALLNSSGRLASKTLIKNLTPQQREAYDKTTKTLRTYSEDKDANLAIDNALKAGVPKELLGKSLIKLWKDGYYPITRLKKYNSLTKSLATKESGTFFRGTGVSGSQYYQNKLGTLPPEMSGEIYQILKTLKGADQAQALSKFVGKPFKMRTSSWSTEESIAGGFAKNTREQAATKKDVVPFTVKTSFKDQDVIPVHSLFKNMYSQKGVPESERMFGGNFVITGINSKGVTVERVAGFEKGTFSVPGPKGAGDITPAMLSPGESVIPTKQSEKHRGLIKSIISDKIPGHMAGRIGKIKPQSSREPLFLGMPKSFKDTSIRIANQKMLDDIDRSIKNGPLGALEPSNFGKLVTETTGHSFPIPGVGGIYEKGGKQLFVKPVTDVDAARAELLSTKFTPAHNLVAPQQEIKTMMDPTDPKGKRRLAVLVSPYDPKFANPDGKFTKQQMADQLYASSLRGDKDLQTANVSGNMVIDAGTSYAYGAASGLRTQTTSLKSVLEQANINTLGVKGGARRAFADSIAPIAQKMTADEFNILMKGTVTSHNARLAQTLATTKLTAAEKEFYAKNILARGKEAEDIDWRQIHSNLVNLEAAPKKKELTAAAIEKKFQEQQLRKRQSGHANEDFYVQPFEEGKLGKAKDTKNKIAALPMDSQSQDEHRRLLKWTEDQIKDPSARPEAKAKWEKSGQSWKNYIAQYLRYDPVSGLYYTGAEGEKGTPRARIEEAIRYNLGLDPATSGTKKGQFISSNKMTSGNPAIAKMTVGGKSKGGGGLKVHNPQAYKKFQEVLLEQEAQNKALGSKGELSQLQAKMKELDPSITPEKIKNFTQIDAAHIEKTDTQGNRLSGRSKEKWQDGKVIPDYHGVNQYMNAHARTTKILEWEAKYGGLGLNPAQIAEYKNAAEFMKTGIQPVTRQDARLVQLAAQLEILAHDAVARGVPNPTGLGLGKAQKINAQAVASLMDIRLGSESTFFKDLEEGRRVIDLKTKERTGNITVGKGEGLLRKIRDKVKLEPVTGQNTTPKPYRATTTGPSGERVAKKPSLVASRQTMQFIGKEKGDLTYRNDPSFSPAFTEASDLSKNSQRNVNKLVNEHIANLKKTNTLSKDDIRAKADNYRRYLIADRLEKANQAEYAKTAPARAKLAAQTLKQEKMRLRQEKVGRVSGAGAGAMGGVAMAAMMSGANEKITTGLFAASALAGLAPMLTKMLANPLGVVGIAAAAAGGALWMLDKKSKDAAIQQSELTDATRATTEKMQSIGEMNQKVGASEIMKQKRQDSVSGRYLGEARGKQQYGSKFLEQDVGKDMLSTITQSLTSGSKNTAKQVALELAGYISDGVLSAEQAHSIADQIGINLSDSSLGMNISGTLLDLVGPGGEDLLKDPLNVRLNLVREQQSLTSEMKDLFVDPSETYITDFFMNDAKGVAAQVAAAGVQNLEFNQAQIDSLNVQYDKQIKILETQKAATSDKSKQAAIDEKILKLQDAKSSGTAELRVNAKKILDQQIKLFRETKKYKGVKLNDVQDAFFESLKGQVRSKYENDANQKPFLDKFLGKSADLEDKNLEVKIDTIVASGQMVPSSAIKMLDMFAGDEGRLRRAINVTTKMQDPGKVQELLSFLGPIENPKLEKEIFMSIIDTTDPAKSESLISTLKLMSQMQGKEFNIKTFFEDPKGIDKLNALAAKLEEVEQIKGPITPEVIAKIDVDDNSANGNGMQGLLKDWKEYANLPNETKKAVIQQYITAYSTITEGEITAEVRRTKKQTGGVAGQFTAFDFGTEKERSDAQEALAAKKVFEAKKQADLIAKLTGGTGVGNGTGGKEKFTELDQLLKRLKFVGDASVKAQGRVAELLRLGSKKNITELNGITQQLLAGPKGGMNRDFILWLEGMDDATRSTYLNSKKLAKGVVELTDKGAAAQEVFNANTFSEYAASLTTAAQDTLAQRAALVRLEKAGFDTTTALDMVSDAGLAVAINSEKISAKKLKETADEAKRAKNEALGLALALKQAADASSAGLKDINTKLNVFDKLEKAYPNLTTDQRKAIDGLGQDAINSISAYLNGSLSADDAKKAAELVNSVISDVNPTIVAKLKLENKTDLVASLERQLGELGDKFSSFFELKRFQLEKKFRAPLQTANNAVNPYYIDPNAKPDAANPDAGKSVGFLAREAADRLAAIQKNIDAENLRYSRQTDAINESYRARLTNLENSIDAEQKVVDAATKAVEKQQRVISKMQEDARIKYDSYYKEDVPGSGNIVINPNSTEYLQEEIDKQNKIIEDFQDKTGNSIETYNKRINISQGIIDSIGLSQIAPLENLSAKYTDDLSLIDHAAEAINKKYDLQEEALNKISAINEEIVGQQKQQLDLAGAIASGDIGAAAKAMQEIQASRVSGMAKTQQDAITAARTAEVGGLTSTTGMTREQIEARQYEISRQIYDLQQKQFIEEEKIRDAKIAIHAIETDPKRVEQETRLSILQTFLKTTTEARALAMKAIAIEEAKLPTLIDKQTAAQDALNASQTEYNRLQDLRDAELKAAETTHLDNLAKYTAALIKAEDDLTVANDNLKIAQDALAELNAAITTEEDKIKSMEDLFNDTKEAILLAKGEMTNFAGEITKAIELSKQLAAALKKEAEDKKKIDDAANLNKENTITQDSLNAKAAADAMRATDAENKAKADEAEAARVQDLTDSTAMTKQQLAEINRLIAIAKESRFQADQLAKIAAKSAAEALAFKTATPPVVPPVVPGTPTLEQQRNEKRAQHSGLPASVLNSIYPHLAPFNKGGMVLPKYMARGGFARGSDTVPAILTPGEFVMSKYAVSAHGVDKMKAMNNGDSIGDAVYNYSVNVNVKSDANPDEIARAVMMQIKQVDGQKIRGNRF